MTYLLVRSVAVTLVCGVAIALSAQQPPATPPPSGQSDVSLVIRNGGDPSLPPKLAVPSFIALTNDAETQAAAKIVGEVIWDDLEFEKEYYMVPRDTYRSIPQPASLDQVPLDRWKELNADAVLIGSVAKTPKGVLVSMRLINVASGASAMAREYSGSVTSIQANPVRAYAHTIADEVHKDQRGLNGIARTKIAFSSDRDGERLPGPVGDRGISNIYMTDYDGARQQRVTISKSLDISPVWSPDGRSIAFSSWRTSFQDIYVLYPYGGPELQNPTKGNSSKQNYLPAWSPDGTKLAFTSNRDGNAEIYVMNRDGSGVQRVTNHPTIDVTPTWSPTGTQIAFTSDRAGTPQIYIIGADGLNLRRLTTSESYADRPTWSPPPFNEIAFAARTGGGYDIKIYDLATGATRQVTFGEGTNESPAYSPNGRHLAFTSTRAGRVQIFTIGRDGRGIKQITRDGANFTPSWSN
jgi:TolB protein